MTHLICILPSPPPPPPSKSTYLYFLISSSQPLHYANFPEATTHLKEVGGGTIGHHVTHLICIIITKRLHLHTARITDTHTHTHTHKNMSTYKSTNKVDKKLRGMLGATLPGKNQPMIEAAANLDGEEGRQVT